MEKRKAQIPLVCHGHSRPIVDLSYSPITPDGFFLVSASKDGKPMLRNGETGDWIGTFEGHKGAVWAACLDTPAMRCATASADFSARVWDALTGDELCSFEHKHIVRTCAFSESTTHLLTGGAEKVLRIFDLGRPDAPPTLLESSPDTPIRAAVWHHSDQTILSSSNDVGGVRVWDVRTKSVVRTLDTKSSCTSVEVSRDGRYITTADGNNVKFWDANHFGLVKSYTMPRPVESASLFPSRGKFIAGGDDMWVRLFDFDTGNEIGETLSRSLSANSSLRGQPSFPSDASTASARSANTLSRNPRQRTSPLNSGLWITIELTITISQIVASIIVLSLSRNEHPQAPLQVRVIGYAVGCLTTLPLFYWRYTHRYVRSRDQNPVPQASSALTPSGGSRGTSYRSLSPSAARDEVLLTVRNRGSVDHDSSADDRIKVFIERFKIVLDCFFAIWFVVGNVWIFGGHSSASDAPNLYRLCIVFLTFSCIGYAMPFILCATICCCLPCIIALLGFREDPNQTKGASADVISALPTYKFKAKSSKDMKAKKDENDSDSEGVGEGGFVAPGTDKERQVSAEDAVCCICLGKYVDGVELRELPCTHHFHVECVDKWLKINASCPLCKHDVGGAANPNNANPAESVDQRETAQPNPPVS